MAVLKVNVPAMRLLYRNPEMGQDWTYLADMDSLADGDAVLAVQSFLQDEFWNLDDDTVVPVTLQFCAMMLTDSQVHKDYQC